MSAHFAPRSLLCPTPVIGERGKNGTLQILSASTTLVVQYTISIYEYLSYMVFSCGYI